MHPKCERLLPDPPLRIIHGASACGVETAGLFWSAVSPFAVIINPADNVEALRLTGGAFLAVGWAVLAALSGKSANDDGHEKSDQQP